MQAILDYELSLGIPPGWVNHCISASKPNGFFHRLETGSIPMDAAFFAGFSADLHRQDLWEAFYLAQHKKNPSLYPLTGSKNNTPPPLPKLDAEFLFNDMMRTAQTPDPWMFPALKALHSSGKYMTAALSNTVIFPEGHPLYVPPPPTAESSVAPPSTLAFNPLRAVFDVFVSSAHVGLRKPDPRIYRLALDEVNKFAKANADTQRGRALDWGADEIRPHDILFLDDIGENLKAARQAGFQTIKVPLGKAYEAVEQLEEITGLELAGDHPKIPIKPNFRVKKQAKI